MHNSNTPQTLFSSSSSSPASDESLSSPRSSSLKNLMGLFGSKPSVEAQALRASFESQRAAFDPDEPSVAAAPVVYPANATAPLPPSHAPSPVTPAYSPVSASSAAPRSMEVHPSRETQRISLFQQISSGMESGLGSNAPSRTFSECVQVLASSNTSAQEYAEAARDLMFQLSNPVNIWTREQCEQILAVADSLAHTGGTDQEIYEELTSLMDSANPAIREAAIQALFTLGKDEAVDVMVRYSALEAVLRNGGRSALPATAAAFGDLIKNPSAPLEKVFDILVVFNRSDDSSMKEAAVQVFQSAVTALIELVKQPSAPLKKIVDELMVLDHLTAGKSNPAIHQIVAQVYIAIGQDEAIPAPIRYDALRILSSNHDDPAVLKATARALGDLAKEPKASLSMITNTLSMLANRSDPSVRHAAIGVLGEMITNPELPNLAFVRDTLNHHLQDANAEVRQAAESALIDLYRNTVCMPSPVHLSRYLSNPATSLELWNAVLDNKNLGTEYTDRQRFGLLLRVLNSRQN